MALIKFHKDIPDLLDFKGGKISVTDKQYKSSDYSLCWEYADGDKLIFNTNIGYVSGVESEKDSRGNAFAMYLFGTGTEGTLRIDFLKQNRVCTGFDINLGFRGWRHIAISFDRDMDGTPQAEMDSFSITASGNGCVLLDEILTCGRCECRHIVACEQMPYISNKLFSFEKDWKLKPIYNVENISVDEISAVAKRYRQYVINEYDCDKTTEELLSEVEELDIFEDTFGMCGKRIEHARQRVIFNGTDGQNDKFYPLTDIGKLMCYLAVRFGKTGNRVLLENYVKILKFVMNSGFAYGNTLGNVAVLEYSLRHIYFSLAVMLEEPEVKPLHPELCSALKWFTHLGKRGFCIGQSFEHSSTDDFMNQAPGIMVLSLMMVNDSDKAWYLKTLSAWIEFNLKPTDGFLDMIKDDGCICHHAAHYPAYGNGALSGIAPILYAFSDTQYDIGDAARENLRKVFLTLRFQSVGTMYATAFSGRHPFLQNGINIVPYRYFAKYELLRGNTEMAAVYLRLIGDKTTEADKDIKESNVFPEEIPSGNHTYPIACANVHRRDNWMLVTKGFSKYVWGSEIYRADNLYGRYRSYGVAELYNDVENAADRYYEAGYDWSRFAGATALKVPLEQLRARIYNLDAVSGFEEMLISDQTFAGGNSLNGNGMFSLILTEHPKYNGDFRAYKSVFIKDNFILAVGSGISDSSGYDVETTLFQNRILPGDLQIKRIGNKIYDNLGNIYYVDESTDVYMNEGIQYSRSAENDKPTEGEFAVAVIKHGVKPKDASYIYGIGVNGALKPEYEIIKQDEKAHIVRIDNIVYMALFEPGIYGDVVTDTPIMVMIEKGDSGSIVSITNPDLDLYDRDEDQYDESGNRREVSIYSRTWLGNRIGGKKANIEICGKSISAYLRGGDIVTTNI